MSKTYNPEREAALMHKSYLSAIEDDGGDYARDYLHWQVKRMRRIFENEENFARYAQELSRLCGFSA